ncbi:MAG: hypothetical protein JXA82_18010 [Sedimentisphaerales bacterium]|nr:hypothetical protein [Sedimentisphaerales bacterium]
MKKLPDWSDFFVVYVILSALLFIYVFPFIFIGFRGNYNDPMAINPTVLRIWGDEETGSIEKYPILTQLSIKFARYHRLRFVIALLQILLLIFLVIKKCPHVFKYVTLTVFLWLNLIVFMFNFLGLILLL